MMKEKRKDMMDELREIAPGLTDLHKDQPYRVPHNYFKQLPDRVLEQIRTEETMPSWLDRLEHTISETFSSVMQPRYALAYASVLVLIIAAILVDTPAGNTGLLSDISVDEALEYVLENIEEYDSREIYALGAISDFEIGGLNDIPVDELDDAIEILLDDMDTESLEELF